MFPTRTLAYGSQNVGLQVSDQLSSFGNFNMKTQVRMPHQNPDDMHHGAPWRFANRKSYHMPRAIEGRGLEYRKFFGEERLVKPYFSGGPQEAVHDANRNKAFFKKWDFPSDLRKAQWPEEHNATQGYPDYIINHLSKDALKTIAATAYESTERDLMWNPYTPHQPVRGPAPIPQEEMEVYRRQAFLENIEFPEFPDVHPQKQTDPWEQDEADRMPDIDNDLLLDREVWEDVNKNMKGMEKRIKLFKDTERKKRHTFEMATKMQQLRRARQEETFMRKVQTSQQKKDEIENQASLKPWERKKAAKKAEDNVSEEVCSFPPHSPLPHHHPHHVDQMKRADHKMPLTTPLHQGYCAL